MNTGFLQGFQQLFDGLSDPVFCVGGSDHIRDLFQDFRRISHGNSDTGKGQHLRIVFRIAGRRLNRFEERKSELPAWSVGARS